MSPTMHLFIPQNHEKRIQSEEKAWKEHKYGD